jgi:hypothetical protein
MHTCNNLYPYTSVLLMRKALTDSGIQPSTNTLPFLNHNNPLLVNDTVYYCGIDLEIQLRFLL